MRLKHLITMVFLLGIAQSASAVWVPIFPSMSSSYNYDYDDDYDYPYNNYYRNNYGYANPSYNNYYYNNDSCCLGGLKNLVRRGINKVFDRDDDDDDDYGYSNNTNCGTCNTYMGRNYYNNYRYNY